MNDLVNESGDLVNDLVNDCISRAAALNVLHGYFDGMLETDTVCPKDLYNEIEALPSAQPGWIPVTEKLPKDDTEVIVSCTDDSGDYEYSYVTTGWHYKGLWVVNNDRCYFVRAWQPLPEKPWEGGQDEQN